MLDIVHRTTSVDQIALSANLEGSPSTYAIFIFDIVLRKHTRLYNHKDIQRTKNVRKVAAGRRAENRVAALAP